MVVCKKLGVDYRIFGGAKAGDPHQGGEKASNETSAIRQVRAVRRSRRTKGRCKGPQIRKSGSEAMAASAGKATIVASASREARIGKAAKRAGRLGMLKEGKSRLFIAGVLPVALYGAEKRAMAGKRSTGP